MSSASINAIRPSPAAVWNTPWSRTLGACPSRKKEMPFGRRIVHESPEDRSACSDRQCARHHGMGESGSGFVVDIFTK